MYFLYRKYMRHSDIEVSYIDSNNCKVVFLLSLCFSSFVSFPQAVLCIDSRRVDKHDSFSSVNIYVQENPIDNMSHLILFNTQTNVKRVGLVI